MPDNLSIVPGTGSLTFAGSPTIIAGKFIENLRRPSRLRGRLSVALFISLFLVITYAAKSHRVCKRPNSPAHNHRWMANAKVS